MPPVKGESGFRTLIDHELDADADVPESVDRLAGDVVGGVVKRHVDVTGRDVSQKRFFDANVESVQVEAGRTAGRLPDRADEGPAAGQPTRRLSWIAPSLPRSATHTMRRRPKSVIAISSGFLAARANSKTRCKKHIPLSSSDVRTLHELCDLRKLAMRGAGCGADAD
jgi:hypothetical protein